MTSPTENVPRLTQAVQEARTSTGQSNPKERLICWSNIYDVGAVLDPFSRQRLGAVACLGEYAGPDETAHLAEIPMSRRLQLGVVVQMLGRKMLAVARANGESHFTIERGGEMVHVSADEATGPRVLERVDGFAQPRVGHVVMGVGVRHEAPRPHADTATLGMYWEQLRFTGQENDSLETRLEAINLVGPILDSPDSSTALALMERLAAPLS